MGLRLFGVASVAANGAADGRTAWVQIFRAGNIMVSGTLGGCTVKIVFSSDRVTEYNDSTITFTAPANVSYSEQSGWVCAKISGSTTSTANLTVDLLD